MGDRAAHASGMPGIALSIQRLLEAAIPHHACPLGCELEQTGDMYHMLSIALLLPRMLVGWRPSLSW